MKGSLRARGKDVWQLTIDLGKDPQGKRLRKYLTIKGNKGTAERKKRELLTSLDLGLPIDNNKITVSHFLDNWLDIKSSQINPRSIYGYKNVIKRYAEPAIGHILLKDVRATHIEKLYSQNLKEGLTPRTVGQTHRILKQAFKFAVRRNFIGRNPFDSVDPPKAQIKEAKSFTAEQLKILLREAKGVFKQAFFIASVTGMRRGEIVALKWEDINFEKNYLSVKRSIVFVPREGYLIKAPKTASGVRPIDLSGSVIKQLKEFKAAQAVNQLAAGSYWKNEGWVLTNPDGSHLNPNSITKAFKALRERFNMPDAPLHGLRHTHATLLLEEGIEREVVQKRLGHTSIVVTSDIYSHVTRRLQRKAADAFEKILINE